MKHNAYSVPLILPAYDTRNAPTNRLSDRLGRSNIPTWDNLIRDITISLNELVCSGGEDSILKAIPPIHRGS